MHGQLFTSDFLREGIRETAGWGAAEAPFIDFRKRIVEIFAAVATAGDLNEAQTEDDAIVPVLKALDLVLGYMNALAAGDTSTVLAA